MTLTKGDLEILRAPFAPHEHEFLNDNAYITEAAITTRLEDVDPAWTFDIISTNTRHTFGYDVQVTCIGRLTICGVSRDGVGQMKVMGRTFYYEGTGNNKKKVKLPEEDHSETNEAEKAAATDALKRAARLFGIGRYLLSLPDWVKDENSIERYLNGDGNRAQPKAQQKPQASGAAKSSIPSYKEGDTVWLTLVDCQRKTGEKGSQYMVFKMDTGFNTAPVWSSDMFKRAGYAPDGFTKEWTVGSPISAQVRLEGKYWTLIALAAADGSGTIIEEKAKAS